MSLVRGGVDPTRGPFTYWIREIPQHTNKLEDGPLVYIMQKDADGNDYVFCEMSQLGHPQDAKFTVDALNASSKRSKNARRNSGSVRGHRSNSISDEGGEGIGPDNPKT